ncbi:MAG TPA: VanZ family protein, partial [Burkholderiaceae bacterium]|nr:VanZ family protein [Burkholderiaceae bacterium]
MNAYANPGRSTLVLLLLVAWAALIVYASWFPFSGWRWPAGSDAWALLRLPWPRWRDPFDVISNLLGYVPLGLLLVLAPGYRDDGGSAAVRNATVLAALLSYALEVGQHLLPQRVPSLLDWLLNSLGAAVGALLGRGLARTQALGWVQRTGEQWFAQRSRAGLTLLLLWPVALLFPTPVALGLGQVWERVREAVGDLLSGSAAAEPLARWLEAGPPPIARLSPAAELAAVALGLLGPCLMTYSMARPGLRRVWLALGAAALGFGVTTLSTALNFGPQHALAWCTASSLGGIGVGLGAALLLLG